MKQTTIIALGAICLWTTIGLSDAISVNIKGGASIPTGNMLFGLEPVKYDHWDTVTTVRNTPVPKTDLRSISGGIVTPTAASMTITAVGTSAAGSALNLIHRGYADGPITCVIEGIPADYTTGTYSLAIYLNVDSWGNGLKYSPIEIIKGDEGTSTYYSYNDAGVLVSSLENTLLGWGDATAHSTRCTELGLNLIVITGLNTPKITFKTIHQKSNAPQPHFAGSLAAVQVIKGDPVLKQAFTGTQAVGETLWSQLSWGSDMTYVNGFANVANLQDVGTAFVIDQTVLANTLTFQSADTVTLADTTTLSQEGDHAIVALSWDLSNINGALVVDMPLDDQAAVNDARVAGVSQLNHRVSTRSTTFKQPVTFVSNPLNIPEGSRVSFENANSRAILNNLGGAITSAGATFIPYNREALTRGSLVLAQGTNTTIAASNMSGAAHMTFPITGDGNLTLEAKGGTDDGGYGNNEYGIITNASGCSGTLALTRGLLNVKSADAKPETLKSFDFLPEGNIILAGGGLFWGDESLKIPFEKDIEVRDGTSYIRVHGSDNYWAILPGILTGGTGATINHVDGGRLVLTGDISGYQGFIDMRRGRLVVKSSGDMIFPGNLNASQYQTPLFEVVADKTLTLAGGVAGSKGLTKQGAGHAVLDGVKAYTGATIIESGSLTMSIAQVATTTVNANTTLALTPGDGLVGASGASVSASNRYPLVSLTPKTPHAGTYEGLGFLHTPEPASVKAHEVYEYAGTFEVKEEGIYSFAGTWDDAILFRVDGVLIFNTATLDSSHTSVDTGSMNLAVGQHTFVVRWVDRGGLFGPSVEADGGTWKTAGMALGWTEGAPMTTDEDGDASLSLDAASYTKFDIDATGVATGKIHGVKIGSVATVTLGANATLDLRGMGDATATLRTLLLADGVTSTAIDVTGRTLTNDQVLVAWKGAKPAGLSSVTLIGISQFDAVVTDTGIIAKDAIVVVDASGNVMAEGAAKTYIVAMAKANTRPLDEAITEIRISRSDANKAYLLNVIPGFGRDGGSNSISVATLDCKLLVTNLQIVGETLTATAAITVTNDTKKQEGDKDTGINGTLELLSGTTLDAIDNEVSATLTTPSTLTVVAPFDGTQSFYKMRVVER